MFHVQGTIRFLDGLKGKAKGNFDLGGSSFFLGLHPFVGWSARESQRETFIEHDLGGSSLFLGSGNPKEEHRNHSVDPFKKGDTLICCQLRTNTLNN